MGAKQLTDSETLFNQSMEEVYEKIEKLGEVNLVVGVPFYNEKVLLPGVLKTLDEGLTGAGDAKSSLIVCVGDPAGADALESVRRLDLDTPHLEFLMKPGSNGRGASIRAILEIADRLEADAVIFAADLVRENGRGLQPDWITSLVEPIRKDYDFVITTFQRHCFEDLLGSFFTLPLLEAFYGYHVKGSLSGIYAIAHDTLEDICADMKFWENITAGYGIDPWLVTRAVCWNKRICEVELGAKLEEISLDKLNFVFKESARSMFECIKRDEDYWVKDSFIIRTPDICGSRYYDTPHKLAYSTRDLALFRYSYYQYKSLYDSAYYEKLNEDARDDLSEPDMYFKIEGEMWAGTVYRLLFKYWYDTGVLKDDILNALTFYFSGRVASFIEHVQALEEELDAIENIATGSLLTSEVASTKDKQRKEFMRLRDGFIRTWEQKKSETRPPLVPAHYLEFVPGIPIVLPKRIEGRGGRVVWTGEMFNRLQSRYHGAFESFVHESLQAPEGAGPQAIIRFVTDFMGTLERVMNRVFPGDLYTEEGVARVIGSLFETLQSPRTFSLKNEIFQEMLHRFPPLNVMIPAGCKTPRELINQMGAREAVSLANLVETRKYGDRSALIWMLDNLRPDGMGEVEIKPVVLSEGLLGGCVKLGSISDLNKLTSVIAVRPFSKGMGGDYPKLRFCLFIFRHIMIAKNYALLWKIYARERKNLGGKIRNSLIGRYETAAFSAHNIFENYHHRALVAQFRALAGKLAEKGQSRDARLVEMMCDSYGLSQVLADGTFLPCSAWSWASYSYKGGRGVPTPMSSHVEEKWFIHDFLEEIYGEMGYDPGEIMQGVTQLIGEGRASENLIDVLLGIRPKDITVIVRETQDSIPARSMVRYRGNPILSPIKEHCWESKYVLNTAAFRIGDRIYLLYRAYGDDEISRIGLAATDGYNILERLPEPVFTPHNERDKKGVEDPRVVIIDDKLYMLYTAWDGVTAQIAAASITVEDFLNRSFDKWKLEGLAFEDIWDKDAILFPEKINDKYIVYHRIEPSIWVSHLDKLEFPAPKDKHSIILGPRSGQMWDSLKIGAGSQPIKTKYGWLLIYHGVDRDNVYRLGVMLVDLNNPELLLYRSPNPVLSPVTEYEVGKKGESWVPNVVFTCGAVPAEDKEVLDAEDKILVYYGAADTHICLACAKVGDLVPERARQEVNAK